MKETLILLGVAVAIAVGWLLMVKVGAYVLQPLFRPLYWVSDWVNHFALGSERPRRGPLSKPPRGR